MNSLVVNMAAPSKILENSTGGSNDYLPAG